MRRVGLRRRIGPPARRRGTATCTACRRPRASACVCGPLQGEREKEREWGGGGARERVGGCLPAPTHRSAARAKAMVCVRAHTLAKDVVCARAWVWADVLTTKWGGQ